MPPAESRSNLTNLKIQGNNVSNDVSDAGSSSAPIMDNYEYMLLLVFFVGIIVLIYLGLQNVKTLINTHKNTVTNIIIVERLYSTSKNLCLCFRKFFTRSRKQAGKRVNQGNQLKLRQNWREAGRAFEAAAEQFSKQRRCELDAANNYSEAANCYRKLPDTRPKAVRCLQQAAEMYAEQGQFSIAARQLEEAGDLLAASQQVEEAIDAYLRAADFWSGEDSPASAAGSRAKAAELMADCGRLAEAAAVFEDLGVSAEQHSLLSFGAKDHLAKSCLCLLCSGAAGVGEKAEQLAGLCGSFKDTDELSLVRSLASATDARDVAAIDAAVSEFERFNNLDDFARRRLDQLRQFVASGGVQLQ